MREALLWYSHYGCLCCQGSGAVLWKRAVVDLVLSGETSPLSVLGLLCYEWGVVWSVFGRSLRGYGRVAVWVVKAAVL